MMDFQFDYITADEYERMRNLHEPLTQAVRELIDAGIRTNVDEETVRQARAAIEAVTASLRTVQRDQTSTLRHAGNGRPLAWANPAVGLRNAIAPPMEIHHEPDGRCWSEFDLGVAYEGPPGLVHGGICALVLDHLLGEAASEGLTKPRFTGTITMKYLRGTPLGPLRAEAFVERSEGHKTYARGYLGRRRRLECRGRRGVHSTGVGARVKFYVSTAFLDTREVIEIARAADDLGYDGMGIPDHVINLETLETPYPYTKDGSRRWEAFTHWPDPWVMIGAIALVTSRLKFVTTVYLPAMRDPYTAAKAIGTAAVLADGRLELGIGVGWCKEEFTLMGQRFDRRGKRTDEMLELMRALWQPGWVEFDGEFYPTPRLEMEPTPPHIPIYVGGLSDVALRRAAHNDGWIGDLITTDRAIASIDQIRQLRAERGLSMDGFEVLTPLTDAFTPEHYDRAEAAGVTGIITMPWMFYAGPHATRTEKVDGMKRFRKDMALDR